jgi:hypothetical protein
MRNNRSFTEDERGSAMVISLLVLLLLTTVGLAYVTSAKTETQITGNTMRWSQALFNAEAGISEAMARMNTSTDSTNYIGEPLNSETPGWGVYLVNQNGAAIEDPDYAEAGSDGRDNDGDGSIDEADESYPEVITKQSGANQIPYPWVKVHYVTNATGDIVRFGDHDSDVTTAQTFNLVEGAPVIRIRSQGDRGTALRRIDVEAVKAEFNIVHAALYAETDDFQFNGVAFEISGADHDPITESEIPGAGEVPGIVTTEDPAEIADELQGNQTNNVEGEGAEPSVAGSPVDLDLQGMYDLYGPQATIIRGTTTVSNETWGGWDEYVIARVDGDLHVSGSLVGGGILLIQGDLDCTGQFTWYGMVLVLGDIQFSGGGAGIHIYGTTLVQGHFDTQVVGGNADIWYSSEALNRLNALQRYQIVSWNEY